MTNLILVRLTEENGSGLRPISRLKKERAGQASSRCRVLWLHHRGHERSQKRGCLAASRRACCSGVTGATTPRCSLGGTGASPCSSGGAAGSTPCVVGRSAGKPLHSLPVSRVYRSGLTGPWAACSLTILRSCSRAAISLLGVILSMVAQLPSAAAIASLGGGLETRNIDWLIPKPRKQLRSASANHLSPTRGSAPIAARKTSRS